MLIRQGYYFTRAHHGKMLLICKATNNFKQWYYFFHHRKPFSTKCQHWIAMSFFFFFFLLSFLFFWPPTLWYIEFQGQGSDLSRCHSLSCNCSNAGSLTHCARPGLLRYHWSRCTTAGTSKLPCHMPVLRSEVVLFKALQVVNIF